MEASYPAPGPASEPASIANEPSKAHIALPVLLGSLAFGLIADRLLHGALPGINIVIVTALFCGALFIAARRAAIPLRGGGRFFAIPALALAACLAVRDTPTLRLFTLLAVLLCIAVVSFRARQTRVLIGSLTSYATAAISATLAACTAGLFVIGNVRWQRSSGGAAALRALIGLLIAAPLLLIFGALFAQADANFGALMRQLFNLDNIIEHALLTLTLSWCAAGLLWLALDTDLGATLEQGLPHRNSSFGFGAIEIVIVLGLLNTLFATFVFTQTRYFFGGAALVLNTADTSNTLTFAEYARRGFFELVLVAALVLGLLLVGHFLTRRDQARPMLIFRALSLLLIGLLYVIIASALHRMWTYMQAYGLTELRVYTTAFMLWLTIVFAWFAITTLRGAAERFAFGFVISGLGVLFALNVANPVDFIVRYNIDRITAASATKLPDFAAERIDAVYLASLARANADALPPLLANLSRFAPEDRCIVAAGIKQYYSARVYDGVYPTTPVTDGLSNADLVKQPSDWRAWNIAREQARNWVTPELYRSYATMACDMDMR